MLTRKLQLIPLQPLQPLLIATRSMPQPRLLLSRASSMQPRHKPQLLQPFRPCMRPLWPSLATPTPPLASPPTVQPRIPMLVLVLILMI
ncbi:hypothetical protein LIER_43175 [Lithospermum erythrorhizon]|uniref:Uncharacterized protein n=1 Tax=Lithospermum erythrorhizon TaxID=34254 RepID=A0AAV3PLG3_LITER